MMNMKKMTNQEFADKVYRASRLMSGYDLKVILTAAAFLHSDKKLYEFMDFADEAFDDANQIRGYLLNKELGYDG